MMGAHVSVLLPEVITALQIKPGGRYIDCTVGDGGHAAAVLEHGGCVLGIDVDPMAIEVARQKLCRYGDRAILINENYTRVELIATETGFNPSDGVLFDLGMSSHQLSDASRGFSFQVDSPLDMRFDPNTQLTASDVVNKFPETELRNIIQRYGEERRSKEIARAIVANRPVSTTTQLATLVTRVVGKGGRIHPATKTFQALRIFVNDELERLKESLRQAVNVMGKGGRLVVISFHSLEDRIVKEFFKRESASCICPPHTPICMCKHRASLKLINKKVVTPSQSEIEANPRSRSAKMRVAERV